MSFIIQRSRPVAFLDRHFCIWVPTQRSRDTFKTAEEARIFAQANAPVDDKWKIVPFEPSLVEGYEFLLGIAGDERRHAWLGRGPGFAWIQGIPISQWENHYESLFTEAGWVVLEKEKNLGGTCYRLSLRHVSIPA
jgi:hypothetical protein